MSVWGVLALIVGYCAGTFVGNALVLLYFSKEDRAFKKRMRQLLDEDHTNKK